MASCSSWEMGRECCCSTSSDGIYTPRLEQAFTLPASILGILALLKLWMWSIFKLFLEQAINWWQGWNKKHSFDGYILVPVGTFSQWKSILPYFSSLWTFDRRSWKGQQMRRNCKWWSLGEEVWGRPRPAQRSQWWAAQCSGPKTRSPRPLLSAWRAMVVVGKRTRHKNLIVSESWGPCKDYTMHSALPFLHIIF